MLLEHLKIADAPYREAIAHALAKIHQKDPRPLISLALTAEEKPVLLGLLRALELLGSSDAIPVFQRAIQNPDAEVRRAVITALASREETRAQQVLLEALRDPDPRLRIDAARTLWAVDPHTVLQALARDPAPEVQEAVRRLLQESARG